MVGSLMRLSFIIFDLASLLLMTSDIMSSFSSSIGASSRLTFCIVWTLWLTYGSGLAFLATIFLLELLLTLIFFLWKPPPILIFVLYRIGGLCEEIVFLLGDETDTFFFLRWDLNTASVISSLMSSLLLDSEKSSSRTGLMRAALAFALLCAFFLPILPCRIRPG